MTPGKREALRIGVRIFGRSVFFFALLLAVLLLWRGSSIFLYEGF